jgi:hypothetical protein
MLHRDRVIAHDPHISHTVSRVAGKFHRQCKCHHLRFSTIWFPTPLVYPSADEVKTRSKHSLLPDAQNKSGSKNCSEVRGEGPSLPDLGFEPRPLQL